MVYYSKKASLQKVKCSQCNASILIKSTVEVCPICEGLLRFLEASKEKQYIVRDWNPAKCELRDVIQSPVRLYAVNLTLSLIVHITAVRDNIHFYLTWKFSIFYNQKSWTSFCI